MRPDARVDRALSSSGTAEIIDVGGGTGAYAFWLAGRGHRVHLVDLMPRHIDIAAAQQTMHVGALTSMTVGDARRLAFSDRSADLVVLAGPLYHLIAREERIRALQESHRVLRQGGVLLSVAIDRYAGVIYGLTQGLVFERDYAETHRRGNQAYRRAGPCEATMHDRHAKGSTP